MFDSPLLTVPSVDGFEVAECGEIRRIDLGVADDEPFVMSAIAGLPADVSAAATQELKHQFGPLAFVISAIQEGLTFDPVRIEVDAASTDGEMEWHGNSLAVLAGNVRRFAKTGGQANAEDGLLDLAVIEQMPPGELVAESIEQRILHQETSHVSDFQATMVKIESLKGDPITVSLDGEIRTVETIELGVRPRSLRIRVGSEYQPNPM